MASAAAAADSSRVPVTRNNVSVASKMHVVHCFDSMLESLGHKAMPPVKQQWNGDKFPLFVTWKKRSPGSGAEWRLRGCIGTFSPKELAEGLREYALIAAFHDSRFTPIVAAEVSHLRCDISLLTQFERVVAAASKAADPLHDWLIGTHGITIDFVCPSSARRYNATFLPEVAKEQGWTHAQTLEELIHKSGFRGRVDGPLRANIHLTRYQSEKESLTWQQYLDMREKLTGVVYKLTTTPELKHKPSSSSAIPAAAAAASSTGTRPLQHVDASDSDEDAEEAADLAALEEAAHHAKKSKIAATANGSGEGRK